MKQQIICIPCSKELKFLHRKHAYQGEHIKFVSGRANNVYRCDHCGKTINFLDNCVAESIWADHGRIPYYPWEHDYIHVKGVT